MLGKLDENIFFTSFPRLRFSSVNSFYDQHGNEARGRSMRGAD